MDFGDFFRHITLVFASYLGLLGIPMPLPVPPQPEDPALVRTAPADSALFVQWFGRGDASADSENRTERLAREPEIRALISKLIASSRGALEHEGRRDQEFEPVLQLFDQAALLFEHPGCLSVQNLMPFSGSLVVATGDGALRTAIENVFKMRGGGEVAFTKEQVAGVEFAALSLPANLGSLYWATIDGYFVLSVGVAATTQAVHGLQNKDAGLAGNPAMQKLRTACKVERPMLRTFADLPKLAEQAPFAAKFWQPLGLTTATAALAESGLEGDGFASRMQLLVPPQARESAGMLGLLRGKPLSQDDLALIPGDATTALAARTTTGGLEQGGLLWASSLAGRDPQPHWERFVAQGQTQVDIDISKDLVANLDDCIVAWNSPGQGGLGFTGAVASLPLRDGKAFGKSLQAMWERLVDAAPSKEKAIAQGERLSPRRGYLGSFEYGGSKVWWMDHIDRDLPFGISWTNTDRHGLVSLQPQQIRTAIDNSKLPNFDKALVRKRSVARRGNATAMIYLDLKGLMEQSYGALLVMFQMESHSWQSEGFGLDLADLPRLESIAKHLGPELTLLEPNDSGWMLTRRGSLPVLDPLLVTAGMAGLLILD